MLSTSKLKIPASIIYTAISITLIKLHYFSLIRTAWWTQCRCFVLFLHRKFLNWNRRVYMTSYFCNGGTDKKPLKPCEIPCIFLLEPKSSSITFCSKISVRFSTNHISKDGASIGRVRLYWSAYHYPLFSSCQQVSEKKFQELNKLLGSGAWILKTERVIHERRNPTFRHAAKNENQMKKCRPATAHSWNMLR